MDNTAVCGLRYQHVDDIPFHVVPEKYLHWKLLHSQLLENLEEMLTYYL